MEHNCQSCRVGFIVTMYVCIFLYPSYTVHVCVCAYKHMLYDVWQVMNKTDGAHSRVWLSRHANTGDKDKDGGHCVGVFFFFLITYMCLHKWKTTSCPHPFLRKEACCHHKSSAWRLCCLYMHEDV